MAKYTFELRSLFESLIYNPPLFTREEVEGWFKDYELTDYLSEEEINVISEKGVWSKDKLARKIVDHYYMRESGFETPALLKHYAKVEMQELMEEYLPKIYSLSLKYDPLSNMNYEERFARETENSGTSNSTSNSSSSSLGVNSDTPQGEIRKSEILGGKYASSTGANETENNINDRTNSSSNGLENYTKTIKGNNGNMSYQLLIREYRNNIMAIDRDIIKRLNTLFMGLY